MDEKNRYEIEKKEEIYVCDRLSGSATTYKIHNRNRFVGKMDRKDDGEWYLQQHSPEAEDLRTLATILDNLNKGSNPTDTLDVAKYVTSYEKIVYVSKMADNVGVSDLGMFIQSDDGMIIFRIEFDYDEHHVDYTEEDLDKLFDVYQRIKGGEI